MSEPSTTQTDSSTQRTPQMERCECEHADHFDGGPAHPYGNPPAITTVKTSYGTFAQCAECRREGHGTAIEAARPS